MDRSDDLPSDPDPGSAWYDANPSGIRPSLKE